MRSQMRGLRSRVSGAVAQFWATRERQAARQEATGKRDQGGRGAVTAGAQMDGFLELLTDLIVGQGLDPAHVFHRRRLELPGFFRAEKQWDLVVVKDDQLVVTLEVKSQAGSFGNNLNNRAEEAMGSALDLWTAYREELFNTDVRPWLGYLFLLESCEESERPVRVREPHFEVLAEFKGASYAGRYELFCRKLVRERHYTAAAFLKSRRETGRDGAYEEPAADLTFGAFVRSLMAHCGAYGR